MIIHIVLHYVSRLENTKAYYCIELVSSRNVVDEHWVELLLMKKIIINFNEVLDNKVFDKVRIWNILACFLKFRWPFHQAPSIWFWSYNQLPLKNLVVLCQISIYHTICVCLVCVIKRVYFLFWYFYQWRILLHKTKNIWEHYFNSLILILARN